MLVRSGISVEKECGTRESSGNEKVYLGHGEYK